MGFILKEKEKKKKERKRLGLVTSWKKRRPWIKGNPITFVIVVKRLTKKDIPLRRLPFPWIGIECTFGLYWKGKQTRVCVFCVGFWIGIYTAHEISKYFFLGKIILKLSSTVNSAKKYSEAHE